MATIAAWHGCPMHQRQRGRDSEPPGLLFLAFTGARREAAQLARGPQAPASAAEVAQWMQPAFRGPVGEDIRAPGRHQWECFGSRGGARGPPASFRTTALRQTEWGALAAAGCLAPRGLTCRASGRRQTWRPLERARGSTISDKRRLFGDCLVPAGSSWKE
ncbi:unnamed protein product, partial [Prorocentrum cordatum]